MSVYLEKQKFPLSQMSVEWAYNITESCTQYSSDPDIQLFHNILTGCTEEDVYHHDRREIERLKAHLNSVDEAKVLQV